MQSLAKQSPENLPSMTICEQSLRSSVSLLEGWIPAYAMPKGLSSTMLMEAISLAEQRLTPVTEQQIMVGIAKILRHASTYSIPNVDAKAVAESYRIGVAGMPGLLFEEAVLDVVRHATDTFRVPPPGAIWERIRDKHVKWSAERNRLRTAQWKMEQTGEWVDDRVGPREMDPETQRIFDETMAKIKATPAFKRVPR